MTTPYQPRYQWRPTEIHGETLDLDWVGYDGDQYIGRVRRNITESTPGRWMWAGSYPRMMPGTKPLPNVGTVDTARIATQMVEEFWDMCLEKMRAARD